MEMLIRCLIRESGVWNAQVDSTSLIRVEKGTYSDTYLPKNPVMFH